MKFAVEREIMNGRNSGETRNGTEGKVEDMVTKLSGKRTWAKDRKALFQAGPEYMFDMCSSFSLFFCRAVDEKETENDCVLQFFLTTR